MGEGGEVTCHIWSSDPASESHAIRRYTVKKTNVVTGLHWKSNTIACACPKRKILLMCDIKKKENVTKRVFYYMWKKAQTAS